MSGLTSPPVRFLFGLLGLWMALRILFWFPTSQWSPLPTIESAGAWLASDAADFPGKPVPGDGADLISDTFERAVSEAAEPKLRTLAERMSRRPATFEPAADREPNDAPARQRPNLRDAQLRLPSNAPARVHPFVRRPSVAVPQSTFSQPTAIPTASTWSSSGWLLWRTGGSTPALAGGGQLGGSQAGIRTRYHMLRLTALDIAVAGRLSRPVEDSRGGEAAIGLAFRPARGLPVEATVERRIALDSGGRNAWSVGLAGGVYGVSLPHDFDLSAYAQAGIVGARSRDLYGEAAIAAQRPVFQRGRTSLSLGGGVWAAAQPGAARVDIGPQALLDMPAGEASMRLSLGWRQKIAGSANPGSGPVLTLGTDF